MSGGKILYTDFEFNRVTNPEVNLVCCSTLDIKTKKRTDWWLHNDGKAVLALNDYFLHYDIIIGYSAVAECRSLMALGLDPLAFRWIDLFIEYRMMTNHNDRLNWGKQLVDGKVRHFKKPLPKWERSEADEGTGFKPTHSLAEATYKLTGEIRDTEEKTTMRNLIISDPKEFTAKQRRDIMKYNGDDVDFLPEIWKQLKLQYQALLPRADMQQFFRQALVRGRYSAHTAVMEARGYPIDLKKTRNFAKKIPSILHDVQREINGFFPEVKPFRWNKAEQRFSWNQTATKEWIEENHDTSRWMKTDGGKKKIPQLSLSLDAFQRFYDFKHSYPEDNFGAQIVRFLKMKQSLYGFSEKKEGSDKRVFWDSLGPDGRVRPYMNQFAAQSGRSQPAATGFMFLKPAWMRSLVMPDKGKYIASIDYGQQEFFIAALESGDRKMIEAYLSGDPYMYGAKKAGVIPMSGTKESHKTERDIFKNTYLGIQFGMTKYGLAFKLTNDTGRKWSEDDAQVEIDRFEDLFFDYMDWKLEIIEAYSDGGAIILPCGWTMWSDNDNPRSVANVPIQGFGASVMRKAVDLAVERGCKVLFTLHDAIYIEDDIGNERRIIDLRIAMRDAFMFYFEGEKKEIAKKIKLDPFAWSPNYEKDSKLYIGKKNYEVPCSNIYIDERATDEYYKFSKYFVNSETDLL